MQLMALAPRLVGSLVLMAPGLAAQVGPVDFRSCWPLDEGAGAVVADLGQGGFDGTVVGADWAPGVSAPGLEFDGVGDFVAIGDGAGAPDGIAALTQGTISIWFRFDTVPGADEIHPLLYLGDGVGGDGHSGLIIEVGHFHYETTLFFTIYTDDVVIPQCFDTGFDLHRGRWYHFAAVVGEGFNTGYLNGEELVDRHYNFGGPTDDYFFADVADPQVMTLGRGMFAGIEADQYLDGAIDEVRIYDRPLSAEEIAQYYTLVSCGGPVSEVVRAGSPPNPLALLPGVTTGPSIGAVWDPVVDHTEFVPDATLDFLLVTGGPANVPLGPAGTLLCNPAQPPLALIGSPGPGLPFAIPIAGGCPLVGATLSAQGGSLDGAFAPHLANAIDIVVGTF